MGSYSPDHDMGAWVLEDFKKMARSKIRQILPTDFIRGEAQKWRTKIKLLDDSGCTKLIYITRQLGML